jgi:zinc protease
MLWCGLFCLVHLTPGHAAVPSKATQPVALSYEKFTLPNGLEVILHEDHRLPLVAVNLWYHVGPANETAGRTGFAHLFEHLMFEGSKHIGSKAHFRYLESAGASGINGTTDFDRTNYFETLPSNQLELALWLESDRMGYLLDGLDAEKVANQRDVVRNERRQSYENAPYGLVREEIWHQLFPPSHPYHADVIGSHADVEAARLDEVREFSREYYTPNNASLAIAGDLDPREVRKLVEKYFGSIPAGPPLAAPVAPTVSITAERRVTVSDQIELPRVYMAWITDPIFQPGDAEADLAAQILGGGRSSRLYRKLVHDLQIAQDVSVSDENLRFGSVFTIAATAKPGVALADLEAAIDAELEQFRRAGPSEAELERARNIIETRMLRALQRLGGFGGVADTLNRYNQFVHDPGYLARDLARYDRVTTAAIQRIAAAKLQPASRVVVEGVPGRKVINDPPRSAEPAAEASAAASALGGRMPDEPWRTAAPAPGPAPAVRLAAPIRFQLENGLNVLVAEDHALPIVTLSVVARAGTNLNPVEHPGLAAFTVAMLQEGTERRSALAIADAAAQAGASLATRPGRDAASVSLTVLKGNIAPASDLLADVVRHSRMNPEDVERVRKLRAGRLQQLRREPGEVSRQVLLAALFGLTQPLGFVDEGSRESNAHISAADLSQFRSEHYTPRSTALVLTGDIKRVEARALAERYFGSWVSGSSSGATAATPPATAAFEPGAQILLVDQPGAPQSTIRTGLPGPPRATPDFVPLEILNDVYGGLFSSRLNMNLREEHGYTYGASSGFRYGTNAGYFTSATQVRSDVTLPALKELLHEQSRMHETPPNSDELALARGAFAQSLAALFETSESSSGALAELFVYDLPVDYYTTLAPAAYAVTPIEVKTLADRYLDSPTLKIVIVGDREKLEPGLRALGAGRVIEVDDEGRPKSSRP